MVRCCTASSERLARFHHEVAWHFGPTRCLVVLCERRPRRRPWTGRRGRRCSQSAARRREAREAGRLGRKGAGARDGSGLEGRPTKADLEPSRLDLEIDRSQKCHAGDWALIRIRARRKCPRSRYEARRPRFTAIAASATCISVFFDPKYFACRIPCRTSRAIACSAATRLRYRLRKRLVF